MEIDPSMWLNSVRAVPAIGLRFKSTFDTPSTLISRIKPLLFKWQAEFGGISVGIEKDFAVKIDRPDGVELKLTPEQFSARFFYISSFEERGHPQAVVKYQCEKRPFAELCALVNVAVADVLSELAREGNRTIERIGVVAQGNLDPDVLPPGVEMYLDHIGSLWPLGAMHTKSVVLAKLNESSEVLDRCHHIIERPIDDEAVVSFKLDWQRVWTEPDAPSLPKVRLMINGSLEAALDYFGRFGIGDLSYAANK